LVNKIKIFCILTSLFSIFFTHLRADDSVTTTAAVTEGSVFPYIYIQSIEDKFISLPYEVTSKAQVSLIILTFARPDDGDMASWVKPFSEKYENNTRTAYYELALVGDVGIVNGLIFNGMRGGATEHMRKHLLVYFHDRDPYKKMFGVQDNSLIYSCLVDQKGVIKLIKTGKRADPKDIETIMSAAESLLNRHAVKKIKKSPGKQHEENSYNK
jgi:hypothetical protein